MCILPQCLKKMEKLGYSQARVQEVHNQQIIPAKMLKPFLQTEMKGYQTVTESFKKKLKSPLKETTQANIKATISAFLVYNFTFIFHMKDLFLTHKTNI